ncbi:MAG: Bax inhibitor-1/YccA family protein [Termitinemataceae bacterium]|nr:MAG: Bax inhibitor-1/YccA family protein [Termitinemataceae bacterium]
MDSDVFAAQGCKAVDTQRSFITGVYLWMGAALAITGITAYLTLSTGVYELVFTSRFAPIVLVLAELGVVMFLSARINSLSAFAATLLFLVYSTLNGVTFSVIFLVYTSTSIATVFFITAGMFAGMSVFGFITKADLTKMRSILGMALWGIIIASVVNLFLRSSGFNWLLSFITVIVFSGLTVYDAQKLTKIAASSDYNMQRKQSIIGALNLYLDFINMFLAMLRIFGRRN